MIKLTLTDNSTVVIATSYIISLRSLKSVSTSYTQGGRTIINCMEDNQYIVKESVTAIWETLGN